MSYNNNSYGPNSNGGGYGGNSYGNNNSYGGNSNGSPGSYGGYGAGQRPGQYGQQQQYGGGQYGGGQYGQNQGYGGNQPGQYGQQQQYGGQYGQNHYGQNQYGQNQYYGDQNGPAPEQVTAEDVDKVAQQIRDVRQESVQSTRNALRALQEADESAGRTMNQLSEQSEQLGRIERNLDSAQIHADNAQQKAGELKTVNRSMFAIHIKNPFNSTKKKERELEEAKRKAAEEMAQREAIRKEEYESKQRVNAARGQGPYASNGYNSNSNSYSNNGRGGTGEQSMYSFENTAEDDAAEAEINQNLDMMGGFMDRLKNSAMAMNVEVNRQNERMVGVSRKTDDVHGSVQHNTQLLQKIAKRG
ncbi:Protein transport protein S9 plasma membrane t-SNARE [Lobosporangium transversale]|uniref:t-SNARE coiled-coil homology domain-containing protein n=1 Tax=Lobosporangium transversale TaxID=64571 RepID=A0A1Y2GTK3_9FUNG|nr:hypothetical protein BCR41DRAFT_352640 [Lobosporangium transversale]KAF9916405.1 Protein transport protein S9 plasma membrane t-SNARE [Lobosporangium transversale]ORZ17533.1 hypothetical protein BCR41DRAFT_352640 [Lobosporangium transversale]|eukprot:XP_021881920.1 hypothetical protein BCR41DRAFT_352640 [Lobosporangium transversale]